jgi:serine protease Do
VGKRTLNDIGEDRTCGAIYQGSGFFIGENGEIATNYHVIQGASKIDIFVGNKIFTPQILGIDPISDLALLKIEKEDCPYLTFGNSDALKIGQPLAALGAPVVLTNRANVFSTGILSGKGPISVDGRIAEELLWHTAQTSGGNSGGPVVNGQGEVIGVTRSGDTTNTWAQCIPSNKVLDVLEEFFEIGYVNTADVGFFLNPDPVTGDFAKDFFGWEGNGIGYLITEIMPHSAATDAGLQVGDLIVQYDGQEMNSRWQKELSAGQRVALEIVRDRELLTIPFVVGGRMIAEGLGFSPLEEYGITVEEPSKRRFIELGYSFDVVGPIVSTVACDSLADSSGLRPGMIITEMMLSPTDIRKIQTIDDLEKGLLDADGSSGFYISLWERGDKMSLFIPLTEEEAP